MKQPVKETGQRIREIRKSRKMTQQDLADAMKVTVQSVSQWETGRTQPDNDRAVVLARTLNVPWSWLVAGEENADDRVQKFDIAKSELEKRLAPITSKAMAERLIGALAMPLPDSIDEHTLICRYPAKGTMFSIEIDDDAASPALQYGDVLVCDSGETVRPGDIVLARPWADDRPEFSQVRSIGLDDRDRKIVTLRSFIDGGGEASIDLGDELDRILAVVVERRRYREY